MRSGDGTHAAPATSNTGGGGVLLKGDHQDIAETVHTCLEGPGIDDTALYQKPPEGGAHGSLNERAAVPVPRNP